MYYMEEEDMLSYLEMNRRCHPVGEKSKYTVEKNLAKPCFFKTWFKGFQSSNTSNHKKASLFLRM